MASSSSSSSSSSPSSFSSSSPSSSSRKRLWSPEEDSTLIECVEKYGPGKWNKLARISDELIIYYICEALQRNGNSCRFRWMNYLNSNVTRDNFTEAEDNTIIKAQASYGNRWSKIALQLHGRTDNQIKNRWNSHLSKREVVSKEDGRANHNEIHQDKSYQHLSHDPFLEYGFHLDVFSKTFPEHEHLPHEPFPGNDSIYAIFYQPFFDDISHSWF